MKGSLTDLFANLGDDSRAATTRGIKKTRLDCKPVDLMNFWKYFSRFMYLFTKAKLAFRQAILNHQTPEKSQHKLNVNRGSSWLGLNGVWQTSYIVSGNNALSVHGTVIHSQLPYANATRFSYTYSYSYTYIHARMCVCVCAFGVFKDISWLMMSAAKVAAAAAVVLSGFGG